MVKMPAAVGFALVVDQLMIALTRQGIEIPLNNTSAMVLFDEPALAAAVQRAGVLRAKDVQVTLMQKQPERTMEDYEDYCRFHQIHQIIDLNGSEENVREV